MKIDKNGEEIKPLGYEIDSQYRPVRHSINLQKKGDHGCDPVGDGTFRMVPSGDIVSLEEMRHRLGR